jgi:hypothetical protein
MRVKWSVKQGLGVGCAVLLVCLLAVVGGGTWYAVQLNKDYKAVDRSEQAMITATDSLGAFIPPREIVPAPERLELFTAVREDLTEWRANLARASGNFAAEQAAGGNGSFRRFLRVLSSGSELAPVYADFWEARNKALQKRGLGPEEYIYLYCLVFYSWLGNEPRDAEIPERISAAEAGRAINSLMVPLLGRVRERGTGSPATAASAATDILVREYHRLLENPDSYPWPAGLPATVAGSLEPFRSRLAVTYDPAVNPVELMFNSIVAARDTATE